MPVIANSTRSAVVGKDHGVQTRELVDLELVTDGLDFPLVNGGVVDIPADGDPDGVVHWTLPDRLADNMVTNICFGVPDLTTAYLTCSHTGRLVRCTWHRPGLALHT